MKKIVLALALIFITTTSFAVDITLTIPADKVARVSAALLSAYPIPLNTMNEEGELINDELEVNAPLYGQLVWFKMIIKDWIVTEVESYENGISIANAEVEKDTSLVE